jgi:hypothetical protein
VKGHSGIPGNEGADILAVKAAEKVSWTAVISLAYLKLRASEKFRLAKEKWDGDPAHERTEEIPPPPPKKSCLDQARNALARTTQIRTGQLAVYCVPQ